MKVEFSPAITNQKNNNLLHKVRKFFIEKTKPLVKDSFEKNTEKKVIISRKHPNWCDAPEDGYRNNTIADKVCYYPEDVKKMESMTPKERIAYEDYLDREKKFYYEESMSKEKFESVMRSIGINPEQFYKKNKK